MLSFQRKSSVFVVDVALKEEGYLEESKE